MKKQLWLILALAAVVCAYAATNITYTGMSLALDTNGVVRAPGTVYFTNTIYAPSIGASNNHFVIVTGSSNVGVGVAVPGQKLDVDGSVRIAGNDSRYLAKNAANVQWGLAIEATSGDMQWKDNGGTEWFRIRQDGNVGIGPTAPNARLHIGPGNATNAPIMLMSGTVLTTPKKGAIEYNGSELSFTDDETTNRQDLVQAAYGELFDFAGQTLMLTNAGTFYGFTSLTQGLVKYTAMTDNATADRLTFYAGCAGAYRLLVTGSWYGTASMNAQFRVYKSGTALTNMASVVQMDAGQTVSPFTISGITTLTPGDYLDVRVSGDGTSNTITAFINLSAIRIDR
jgi:hypothetical protein